MLVWLPPGAGAAILGPLPAPLTCAPFGTGDLAEVEVVVLVPPQRDEFAAALPALTGLRVVQLLTSGVDWVPPLPGTVRLCNSGDVHSGPVAEWVLGAVLAMRRGLVDAARRTGWDGGADSVYGVTRGADDLADAHVLVIGYGSVGRAVGARLTPFGARVTGLRRSGPRTLGHLPELLPTADVVVLSTPLTPETAGLADARFLAAMRPGALLVNASHGGVVDTDALVGAVAGGLVRAVLDVTDPQPLPAGHPLWTLPGALVTPHLAGPVARWRARAWALVGGQLRRYAAGQPLLHVRTHGY